jgi:hypothetical protein
LSLFDSLSQTGFFDTPQSGGLSTRFPDGVEPTDDEYYSFSFMDTVKGLPRGVLSAGSDLVNLVGLPFDYEVSDRFGLMEASRTIGGDITSGVSNFLSGFVPGLGVASKLGKIGTIGKISTKIDKSIAGAVNGANAARLAGDFTKAAQLGRKAAVLGTGKEFARVTTAGFIGDFAVWDGHEARLSELLMAHTELEIPVLDWLAAGDDDTLLGELNGRLKNAIEGAGLGLVVDGLLGSLRIMRAGKKAVDNGVSPTKAMVMEARVIRESQEKELMDAFGLEAAEAQAANILIDRMGIDRSRLRIVGGEEAMNIYSKATGELLNSIPVSRGRRYDVDAGIRSILKADGLSARAIDEHPLVTAMPEALKDSIRSNRAAQQAVASWNNGVSRLEELIVPLTEAGAAMHGGYDEMVEVLTHHLGTQRMQSFAMFSAVTSPQTQVPIHTEVGLRLAVASAAETGTMFDQLAAAVGKNGKISRAKASKILKEHLYTISDKAYGRNWVGSQTQKASSARMENLLNSLQKDAGTGSMPAASHASNAMRVHNLMMQRFFDAAVDAVEGGYRVTAEDIFRTLDFSDVPRWFGGDSANKMRGFMGSSMGLRADQVVTAAGDVLPAQGPNQALDTWMARLLPDDIVVPKMVRKTKEVVKRDADGNTVRDASGKAIKEKVSYEAMESLLEAKKRWLTNTGNYASYATVINKVAKAMGMKPYEVQERVWGSIVSIIALKAENVPLDQILRKFSAQDIRKVWDLSEVFLNERIQNAIKPFLTDDRSSVDSIVSVLEEIRTRVRTRLQGAGTRPSSLVSDRAAFEAAVERVGASRGQGAHSVLIDSRRARGLTKASDEFSYDWLREFDKGQADTRRRQNLPPAGMLRDEAERRGFEFADKEVLGRRLRSGRLAAAPYGRANPNLLRETVEGQAVGFALFAETGDAIIGGLRNADFGTAVHELGHVARRFLFSESVPTSSRLGITNSDIDKIASAMGASRDPMDNRWVWSIESEERFTNTLIRYLRTGDVPSGGYRDLFMKIKLWLRNVFNDLDASEGVIDGIDPEVAKVLDKLLNRGPDVEIAGVTAGRIGGPSLLKSAPAYGPDREFPPKPSMGPNPARLGTPAGSGGIEDPYGAANWDRFSSNPDVSAYIKEMIEDYTNIDEFVPLSHTEVVAQSFDDYTALASVVGNRSSANIREALDATKDITALRQIGYKLQAMRRLVSDVSARTYEIAKKGDLADGNEIYEYLRGRRIVEQMMYDIRAQQTEIGRLLGEQRITHTGNPNRGSSVLFPPLPREADPSQMRPQTRPVREVQAEGPREVPDEAAARPTEEPAPTAAAEETSVRAPEAEAEAPAPVPQQPAVEARIPSASPAEVRGRVIQQAVQEAGGRNAIVADMRRFAAAQALGGAENGAKYIRGASKWSQSLIEYWMNSILSGPVTHAVNMTSNMLSTLWVPFERGLGHAIRGEMGAAYVNMFGRYLAMANQFTDSIRLARMAFSEDENILEAGTRSSGLAELPGTSRSISSANLGGGAAVDWIGKFLNLPTRLLAAEDEFFKQLNYRSRIQTELQMEGIRRFGGDPDAAARWSSQKFEAMTEDGRAYTEKEILRRAHAEASKRGLTTMQRNKFVVRYMRDPNNWDPELGLISQRAVNDARYSTFTTPLDPEYGFPNKVASAFQKVAESVPPMRFLLPFIRTPTNLLNFTLERIPGVNLPYSRRLWKDAERNLIDPSQKADLIGRFSMSLGFMSFVVSGASAEIITGGGPIERDRRELWESSGWRPYSIRIGNTYYSYRRFDPFASILGIVADAIELNNDLDMYGSEQDRGSVDNILYTLVYAIARNITNKTYLTGLTNFSNAVSNPKQYGQTFVNSFVGSMVPFSSALGQSTGFAEDEPLYREINSVLDSIKSKIPGVANELPPRRDLFGEPVRRNRRGLLSAGDVVAEDSPLTMFSPFEYSEVNSDKVAAELRRLDHPFDSPNPQRGGGIDLREYTTDSGQQAYDRWLQLHGEVTIGGLTLRKYMEKTMATRQYQNLSPVSTDMYKSPRVRILRRIISRFRERAFDQMIKESSALREVYRVDQARRAALLSGQRADELMNLVR